jgi:ribosomal protein S18 acetylase RimI-like enzyme
MQPMEPSTLPDPRMQILPANLLDLGHLRRVEQACFPQDAWPLLDLMAVLTWPEVIRLKAVIDGQMVGFIAGDPRRSENMAWIATLGVLPEFRRRGIARALLLACEKLLGTPRLRLCVRVDNAGAIRLYEQEGYLRVGLWKKYYNNGGDALVMEKIRETPPLETL